MNKEKTVKKKRSHFFEIYILKVLAQISEHSSITSNAKQQLNSVLCILARHISKIALDLTIFAKKKTITEKEVGNALKIILLGELLNNAISEGEKAVINYKNYSDDTHSEQNKLNIISIPIHKQNKANILFSPSLIHKFLRQFGYIKIMVSVNASVYLAAVLEYLTFEVLDLANMLCIENKRIRLTIRDLELSIRSDTELDNLFVKLNINLLGGGVVPFIHSSLLNKQSKNPLRHHKFHTGTVALRNIKKQQKYSDSLIFTRKSFEQFVRHIVKENSNSELKISKGVFITLQYFIEQYIVNMLKNANYLAIHAGRTKLTPVDIGLISFLQNKSKNPYIDDNIIDIFSVNNDSINSDDLSDSIESSY